MSDKHKPALLARFLTLVALAPAVLALAVLALAVSIPSVAWASEDGNIETPKQELNQDEGLNNNPVDNETTQQKTTDEKAAPEKDSGTDTPEQGSENLKNRELGDAFRSFQPSEEISADNAVPFPVDI